MIPKLMGAVRLNAPNNLEYCQVPVKEPDEYEVLCKGSYDHSKCYGSHAQP